MKSQPCASSLGLGAGPISSTWRLDQWQSFPALVAHVQRQKVLFHYAYVGDMERQFLYQVTAWNEVRTLAPEVYRARNQELSGNHRTGYKSGRHTRTKNAARNSWSQYRSLFVQW